jgi:hypothetical protein
VVFGFFFGSYCLIATLLNWVTKKINRAQSGSSRRCFNQWVFIVHKKNNERDMAVKRLVKTTKTEGSVAVRARSVVADRKR